MSIDSRNVSLEELDVGICPSLMVAFVVVLFVKKLQNVRESLCGSNIKMLCMSISLLVVAVK